MRISASRDIAAEPGAVFRWIEDPDLASRWQPDVAEHEITRAGTEVVGTEFREVIRDGSGSLEVRGRVSAHVPGTSMEFELAGRGLRIRARYVLTPVASGTRLTVRLSVRVGGPLSWAFAPFVRRGLVARLDADLSRLQELCEAE
ncbi:MAG: hypothetical protein GXX79_08185 [Actinomycetales bacterium]|nr:hypothetical protein [Actinomycetales bacterium]